MNSYFILQHLHVISENNEDIKFIGIFSNMNNVYRAIESLTDKPGFKDFPKLINANIEDGSGFYVDEYQVDKINWNDGYYAE